MHVRKYRWSRTYEPSEFELIKLLKQRGIDAEAWEAEAGRVFTTQSHQSDKRLWCAEGSIAFDVNGKLLNLQAGDSLELPAGTVHSATVGLTGCTVYESPEPTIRAIQPAN